MTDKIEELMDAAAVAVRDEILRQYRDDDRGKCPAGSAWYEEHVAPGLIARAAEVVEECARVAAQYRDTALKDVADDHERWIREQTASSIEGAIRNLKSQDEPR